ncbi:Uncharacterized protein pbN1_12130 [Aromatoleum bremense]|nr:Uncharacterized protein pbN1_12130 [Aromatoleum bremense]
MGAMPGSRRFYRRTRLKSNCRGGWQSVAPLASGRMPALMHAQECHGW